MYKTTTICLVAYSLSVIITVSGSNNTKVMKCSPETTFSLNGHFVWKIKHKDMDYAISEPDICWRNNTIVVRQCDMRGSRSWIPGVESCEKIIKKNSICPEDLSEEFINGKPVCLKISEKPEPFNESYCYGSNYILNSNDHELMTVLLDRNIERFWLPVRRIQEKRFKPFVIRLPGVRWNKLYNILFEQHITFSKQHCVGVYLKKGIQKPTIQIEPTDCNDAMYSVCTFIGELVAENGCPQNSGALSYRPNECYGVTWEGQKYPEDVRMLNVVEYYEKYNVLRTIFDKHKIGMDGDIEVRGTSHIPNGKWVINMKTDKLSITPLDTRMRSLCFEYVRNRKNVELVLRKDSDHETLVLTVYNKFYIWSVSNKNDYAIHCFTHASYGELINVKLDLIWENEQQTKTMFELDVQNDYPSQYWCEAHTIFKFTIVSSAKIVAARKNKVHNFATQFDVALKINDTKFATKPLHKVTKALNRKMEKEMDTHRLNNLSDLIIHNVRIMDILDVHPDASQLRCLCHITVSLKSSATENNSDKDCSTENEDSSRRYTDVRTRTRDLLVDLIKKLQPHRIGTVRSTDYCFPESQWPLASIGQTATLLTFCLQVDGLPLTRKCLGNFLEGAYWETISGSLSNCITDIEHHLITKDLFDMDVMRVPQKDPQEAVKGITKLLERNLAVLIPADLHYLAKIIRNSIKSLFKYTSTKTTSQPNVSMASQWDLQHQNLSDSVIEIVRIYNYLMNVNAKIMHSSLILNSTNILLDTFEYLMDEISINAWQPNAWKDRIASRILTKSKSLTINESDKVIDVVAYEDVGVVVNIASNFVIFSINPRIANVTGVALFQADVDSDEDGDDIGMLRGAFENEYYQFIFANQSINDLLNKDMIVVGAFVPASLWHRLDEISCASNKNISLQTKRPEPSVVIKMYSNDKLFQEDNNSAMSGSVMGKVISISIPGHDKDLPEILPLILTTTDAKGEDHKHYCSYWNYKTWAEDGVMLLGRSELNNNTILCGCTHLTPFAYLVRGSYNLSVNTEVEVIVTKIHENALNIITFLGCSLSLFGIVGIFTTACIFRTWRQKANSKVLLQLSAAIALQMVLFCFVNTNEYSHHLIANEIFSSCIAIGAFLHYSVLVQFCWMVIIAYLQFKRYVQVFGNTRPKRFFIKSTLVGWVLPIIPVALVLAFDSESYIPHANDANNPICYPSGKSLYISIVLPIALVVLTNLVIFVVVILNIVRNPTGSMRHTDKSLALSQIRLLVLLFFLLGFTWIFGLMTAVDAGLVFSYLFCLTATLQGFVLFIYFILMDPVTRRMWWGNLRRWCDFKDSTDNSSSIKHVTQSS